MIRSGSPEAAILAWLAEHGRGTASEIAAGCGIAIVSVRGRLAVLDTAGFVSGELFATTSAAKAYTLTERGRRTLAT